MRTNVIIAYVHVKIKHIHAYVHTNTYTYTHNFSIRHNMPGYELLEVTLIQRHVGKVEKQLTNHL